MQKWMPLPNARQWCAFSRVMSKRSGSGKTLASWPDAASHRNSFEPSGISTPPIVTSRLVIRRHTGTDVS